ncbi:IclR family transcriptional regulator [Arthrobacter sp. M4]|uniref:IclR family transcriptional regulator n=1 Tax=Arthrobacter sp. M4 TaxID=218160 RepID=UPI001CDB4DBD|nr:IclR family transcriptional regulator [Arthrobacter sp. M4]MCA4133426.1 IclR family transcriptional regulator [Arthrobacter sp. M4]
MTTSQEPAQPAYANRSVTRAIRILRALAASEAPMTVTDVAKKIELARATTFRLLVTLEEEGIVDRQDTLYSLGWDLARIAQSVDPASGLVPRIKDILEEFADEARETVTFSLRHGLYELDLVLQASPKGLGMKMSEMYGMRWPHHASATGKLLLAELAPEQVEAVLGDELEALTSETITDHEDLARELKAVRERGWASTIEELEEGIIAFAAPVRDSVGTLVGAVAVVGPRHRMEKEEKQAELPARLIAVAQRVQRRMNPST